MDKDNGTRPDNARALDRPLKGRRVAILATDGFESSELTAPRTALVEAGATTHVIAPHRGSIRGSRDEVPVDRTLDEANAEDYDALLLPGGADNAQQLRLESRAVRFVRSFFESEKPVAAICHGPLLLIDAGVLPGRRLTSWPSIANDLQDAGGRWEDAPVVADRGLVTSRKPDDIAVFNARMLEEFVRNNVPARTDRTLEV